MSSVIREPVSTFARLRATDVTQESAAAELAGVGTH